MCDNFDEIVDYDFTANMEDSLDEIENGTKEMLDVLKEFYEGFEKDLESASKTIERENYKLPVVETDIECEKNAVHYNMIFPGPKSTEELLHSFPEYKFEGGAEGHFIYPRFVKERFLEIIEKVFSLGGFFVYPHPKQLMISDNPLDYYFRDYTGIEVIYRSLDSKYTEDNYKLYCDILAEGKRLYCCAGGDGHSCCSDGALTTIYSAERKNVSYISHLREGDFVCGPIGIKMCVGDTKMGGHLSFENEHLVVSVSDFHKSVKNPEHKYRLDLISDKGIVESIEFDCNDGITLALDCDPTADFYSAEVFDVNRNLRLALGNPIWNDK
jgi:hypothetical protein